MAGYDPTTSVLETDVLPIIPHPYVVEQWGGTSPSRTLFALDFSAPVLDLSRWQDSNLRILLLPKQAGYRTPQHLVDLIDCIV